MIDVRKYLRNNSIITNIRCLHMTRHQQVIVAMHALLLLMIVVIAAIVSHHPLLYEYDQSSSNDGYIDSHQ